MFLSTPLLTLVSAMTSKVTCTAISHQKPFAAATVPSKPRIPGGSTFEYCPESDPENDIFTIEKIYWEPNPPTISRDQKLFIYGIFAKDIHPNATGTGSISIPESHDPYSPPSQASDTGPFCTWPNFIYQNDEERGLHTVCDGPYGRNTSGPPQAGKAVWVSEDMLFWPLPEGEYEVRLDTRMPKKEDGSEGDRIFCLQGKAYLDYGGFSD